MGTLPISHLLLWRIHIHTTQQELLKTTWKANNNQHTGRHKEHKQHLSLPPSLSLEVPILSSVNNLILPKHRSDTKNPVTTRPNPHPYYSAMGSVLSLIVTGYITQDLVLERILHIIVTELSNKHPNTAEMKHLISFNNIQDTLYKSLWWLNKEIKLK